MILNSEGDVLPQVASERLHARSAINPTQAKRSVGAATQAQCSGGSHTSDSAVWGAAKAQRTTAPPVGEGDKAVHHQVKIEQEEA